VLTVQVCIYSLVCIHSLLSVLLFSAHYSAVLTMHWLLYIYYSVLTVYSLLYIQCSLCSLAYSTFDVYCLFITVKQKKQKHIMQCEWMYSNNEWMHSKYWIQSNQCTVGTEFKCHLNSVPTVHWLLCIQYLLCIHSLFVVTVHSFTSHDVFLLFLFHLYCDSLIVEQWWSVCLGLLTCLKL